LWSFVGFSSRLVGRAAHQELTILYGNHGKMKCRHWDGLLIGGKAAGIRLGKNNNWDTGTKGQEMLFHYDNEIWVDKLTNTL
jgi:hypothetical protein